MTDEFTWYLSRTTGLLSWVLLAIATLWGLLVTSRVLERRPSPAWLLDLHRYLGTLTLALAAVHVAAIFFDDFVDYTIAELFVPFLSDLDTTAVALGAISLWLLAIVQISSWSRGHIPNVLWRRLHYVSAPLIVLAGLHGVLIGTDIGNPIVAILGLVLSAEIILVLGLRVRFGRRVLPARSDT